MKEQIQAILYQNTSYPNAVMIAEATEAILKAFEEVIGEDEVTIGKMPQTTITEGDVEDLLNGETDWADTRLERIIRNELRQELRDKIRGDRDA